MTLSETFCVQLSVLSFMASGLWFIWKEFLPKYYKTVLIEHPWFHLSRSNLWQLKLTLNFWNLNQHIKVVSIYGGPCVVLMLCRIDFTVIHEVWCEPLQTLTVWIPFVTPPPPPRFWPPVAPHRHRHPPRHRPINIHIFKNKIHLKNRAGEGQVWWSCHCVWV